MEDRPASKQHAWTRERGWLPVLSAAIVLTLVGCTETEYPPIPKPLRFDAPEVIGEPCTAPSMGESDIQGHAFGIRFGPPKQVNFQAQSALLSVSAATDLELDTASCEVGTNDLFLRLVIFWLDTTIGDPLYVPSDMFVSIEHYKTSNASYGQLLANFGTVTFDGYDPSTRSLCGRVDVLFNDDEDGYLAGSFKAPMRCND